MSIEVPAPEWVGPAAHDSGAGNKPIIRIVIHSTVGPSKAGQRYNIAAWFRNKASGGSAHYIVDAGGVAQCVWDSRIAWHAPPNPNSLGVELCDWPGDSPDKKSPLSRWDDAAHTAILEHAAELVAGLCLYYDIPIRKLSVAQVRAREEGICGHIDVSRAFGQSSHWDPGNFPWDRFIRMVRAAADRLTGKTKPPTQEDPMAGFSKRDLVDAAASALVRDGIVKITGRALARFGRDPKNTEWMAASVLSKTLDGVAQCLDRLEDIERRLDALEK